MGCWPRELPFCPRRFYNLPMHRDQLIARKQEVIAQIQRIRRQLGREQAAGRPCAHLEARLDALMAEEYHLRLAIDRSPRA